MPIEPAATWLWLWPALAEDVLYRDAAQECEVNGRGPFQHLLITRLLHSFDHIQAPLLAVRVEPGALLVDLCFNGRHSGNFAGIPPTGRSISLRLTIRFVVKHDRIQEIHLAYDASSLLRQLGFVFDKEGDP